MNWALVMVAMVVQAELIARRTLNGAVKNLTVIVLSESLESFSLPWRKVACVLYVVMVRKERGFPFN